MRNYCPLLTMAVAQFGVVEPQRCLGADCAWHTDGACAIQQLARLKLKTLDF